MNLDADGKKRLAAMKAALAAGLPLAGLLAGAPCAAADEGVPPAEFRTRGEEPARLAGAPVPPSLGSLVPPLQAECPTNFPDAGSGTIQESPEEWVVDGFIGFVEEPQESDPPHGDEAP